MRLLWYLSRLAVIATLFGGTAGVVVGMSPAASAAPAASGASAAMPDGWVRCAHLSPDSPAMDIYMYAFGEAGHPMVLRHVSYGGVSEYMAVSPGRYSVAMRAAGAPASSPPILVTSFLVSSRTAYTVAGVGPNPGLREEVLKDQMTPPMGKALVRVIQASLKQNTVRVSYGPDVLARHLTFGSATPYMAVSPGTRTVQFAAPGEHTATTVELHPDSVHTIVVLDSSSGLKVDALTDAVGSGMMPMGGVSTGFGGTAPRQPSDPALWLLLIAAGTLLTVTGFLGLRRSHGGHPRVALADQRRADRHADRHKAPARPSSADAGSWANNGVSASEA